MSWVYVKKTQMGYFFIQKTHIYVFIDTMFKFYSLRAALHWMRRRVSIRLARASKQFYFMQSCVKRAFASKHDASVRFATIRLPDASGEFGRRLKFNILTLHFHAFMRLCWCAIRGLGFFLLYRILELQRFVVEISGCIEFSILACDTWPYVSVCSVTTWSQVETLPRCQVSYSLENVFWNKRIFGLILAQSYLNKCTSSHKACPSYTAHGILIILLRIIYIWHSDCDVIARYHAHKCFVN